MNKVICNICGTSYPENATQCPICGFTRTTESLEASEGRSTYQYVKGGRFSKANVNKRNREKQKNNVAPLEDEPERKPGKKKKSGNAAMVVIIIILLLAIIAVVGYIALRFFLPNDFLYVGLDSFTKPSISQQETPAEPEPEPEPTEDDVEPVCTALALDKDILNFEGINSTYQLNVTATPADTTDPITFTSSNEAVVTVSSKGLITTVGEGSAIITVTCGNITAECNITCTIPTTVPEEPKITLNRKEITFDMEGQTWMLYDGPLSVTEIMWSSDDNNVCTIIDGKVTAIGNGDTTVYAAYGDQKVSCLIHCKFDENAGNSGSVSEAGGENNETVSNADDKTYKLYNPTGLSDDVTIKVGSTFTLKLVDEDKNEATDATWTISDASVCSYTDSTVKALAAGKSTITAEFNGKTYSCIVRVKE